MCAVQEWVVLILPRAGAEEHNTANPDPLQAAVWEEKHYLPHFHFTDPFDNGEVLFHLLAWFSLISGPL